MKCEAFPLKLQILFNPHPSSLIPNSYKNGRSRRRDASLRRVMGFYAFKNFLCCMKCKIYLFRTHFKLQTPNSKLQTKKLPAAPRGVRPNAPLNSAPFCVFPRLRRHEKSDYRNILWDSSRRIAGSMRRVTGFYAVKNLLCCMEYWIK